MYSVKNIHEHFEATREWKIRKLTPKGREAERLNNKRSLYLLFLSPQLRIPQSLITSQCSEYISSLAYTLMLCLVFMVVCEGFSTTFERKTTGTAAYLLAGVAPANKHACFSPHSAILTQRSKRKVVLHSVKSSVYDYELREP